MPRTVGALLLAVGAVACASPLEPDDLLGRWGGPGVSMVLDGEGGRLTYDCGSGRIESGWTVTKDGEFSGTGVHYFGGGPLPAEGRPPHPAEYRGRVESEALTLSVTIADPETSLGPFQLVRDGPEVMEICF